MDRLYRRRSAHNLASAARAQDKDDATPSPTVLITADVAEDSSSDSHPPSDHAALPPTNDGSLRPRLRVGARSPGSSKRASMNLEVFSHLGRSLSDAARARRHSPHTNPLGQNAASNGLAGLPAEILDRVLEALAVLRRDDPPARYTGDLYRICQTCHAFDVVARKHLYRTINLTVDDLRPPTKSFLSKPKSRLKSVRRTLRANVKTAEHVQAIHILGGTAPTANDVSLRESPNLALLDQLASLVMACPNLERLNGIRISYEHSYSRLWHALSTRKELREHFWQIGANGRAWDWGPSHVSSRYVPLDTAQVSGFVGLHEQWAQLKTLVLTAAPSCMFDHERLFTGIMDSLPSLDQLTVSHFDKRSFRDGHLAHLPGRLTSLRLEHLRGVTEDGLLECLTTGRSLAERGNLVSLSLIDLDISSISTAASLLSHLYNLQRLVLCTQTLLLPPGSRPEQMLQPYLSNRNLRFLHWSLSAAEAAATTDANALLAASIRARGLPSLKRLRAPTDPAGTLQAVCRPIIRRPIIRSPLTSPILDAPPSKPEPPRWANLRRAASTTSVHRQPATQPLQPSDQQDADQPRRKSLLVARQQAQARAVQALRARDSSPIGEVPSPQRRLAKRASLRRPLPEIGEEPSDAESAQSEDKKSKGTSPLIEPEYYLEGEEDGRGGRSEGIAAVELSVLGNGLGILF